MSKETIHQLLINNSKNICNPPNLGDVGYDLFADSEPKIVGELYQLVGSDFENVANEKRYVSIDYIEYDTGLIIAPSDSFHSHIFPRSSISKYNLVMANSVAVIDNGYRGTLKIRFKYIMQPKDFSLFLMQGIVKIDHDKIYKKGDKIGQLVFLESVFPKIIVSDFFDETTRSTGGFGSTGS